MKTKMPSLVKRTVNNTRGRDVTNSRACQPLSSNRKLLRAVFHKATKNKHRDCQFEFKLKCPASHRIHIHMYKRK